MAEGTIIELLSGLLIFSYSFSTHYGANVGWIMFATGITLMIFAGIYLKLTNKNK